MDIFCRNLPVHLKHRRFKKELKPILAELGIVTFECRLHGRGHATLTILDIQKARQLLNKYPKVPKGKKISPSQGLTILGTTIFIEEGRNKPDPYLLLSLQEDEEESKRRNQEARLPTSVAGSGYGNQQRQRKFYIYSLSCGTFEFAGERPLFVERWSLKNPGQISFGRNKLTVTVQSPLDPQRTYRLDFEYYIINGCIYLGDQKAPSVTFMTASAPHLYDVPPKTQSLSFFNMRTRHEREEKKKRLSYFDLEHKHVIPTSFTYRLMLTDPHDLGQIRGLSNDRHMPQMDRWRDVLRRDSIPYSFQLGRFLLTLKEQDLPFAVKYQLQRLVWNGELSVSKVGALFPYIHDILSRRSPPFVSKLLMALPKKIHPLSPHADSLEVGLRRIVDILSELEKGQLLDLVQPGQPGYLPQNQTDIHRASVTPTGIYLYGPYAEIQNRVLRRFSQYSDYFLRVEFIEETGDVMNYDINSNLDGIFNDRFREILRDGIIIAERHFRFLGFSHSSLRARTCWFMAEFYQNEEPVTTENLIPKLGNFQHIVSPAKFAARIGQTFSDTLSSIPIDREFVEIIPDVERNGRVFSDGCGTISKEILYRIYRDYPRRAPVRPTVFQIRLSGKLIHVCPTTCRLISNHLGAKGMLSLDSRLIGPKIRLRKSMIKFYANDTNIEICGSGITKLPCYLNAQLIKILEDLGVARDVFMELQRQEVKSLREAVRSPTQAAMFLEHSYIARSTRLPWLISLLKEMGLHHTQDKFLKQAVELAILVRLRDLKYRSRIRVPKAVTLYGIMDETGILKEGQVFVPVLVDNHREILVRDKVVITRSPALHPGDVQLVNAVDVPEDSPLRRLHTCVVFSQHGPRDLPSQLSGGDLDGDIFNIIYDDRFVLHRTAPAADYPRGKDVTLDRPVTIDDVADFFVTFMRQDQLGRIATTHKILADQRASGTFDPDCLTLAELHSTAVDFSKTGTPVCSLVLYLGLSNSLTCYRLISPGSPDIPLIVRTSWPQDHEFKSLRILICCKMRPNTCGTILTIRTMMTMAIGLDYVTTKANGSWATCTER
jgi:hypothetical protein